MHQDDLLINFLIADDSPAYREVLRKVVLSCPTWVIAAEVTNGEDAINCVRHRPPHVALIDIHMPVVNGIETIRNIKQEAPQVVVIAFSGYADRGFHEASRCAGADEYLDKEKLDTTLLAQLVARHFQNRVQ